MMGQTVLLELDRGDEVYVYTFTGSWTADWPHIHFTQFVGINSNNHHFHQTETETDRNSTTTRSSHQAWKLTSSNGVRVDVDEVTQERASWLKYAYIHSVIHIVYSILFLNTLFLISSTFFFLDSRLAMEIWVKHFLLRVAVFIFEIKYKAKSVPYIVVSVCCVVRSIVMLVYIELHWA